MDWDGVIVRQHEALKRVVAALAAMAGLAIGQSPPLWGRCPAGQRGVSGATVDHPPLSASPTSPPQGGRSGVATLPRHLHRAVLRLLRPTEAAVRRLVIVAARDLVVELPPARPRKPDPAAAHAALRSLGLAVALSPADHARAAAARRAAEKRAAARARAARARAARVRKLTLPLLDPLRIPRPNRRRTVPPHAAPRIISFDGLPPRRLPPPPSPDDIIDATRLGLRLAALHSVLDDLPKHARRFARWKARRDRSFEQGRVRRISPLRPGRPSGFNAANRRKPSHEIHEVLADLQYFAREALQPPDTS